MVDIYTQAILFIWDFMGNLHLENHIDYWFSAPIQGENLQYHIHYIENLSRNLIQIRTYTLRKLSDIMGFRNKLRKQKIIFLQVV